MARIGEVLVVDDDEGSRKALAEVLSDEGYQVATLLQLLRKLM